MIKGFKVRLFPTEEQEILMWKHVGCSRYIYNYMLELQKTRYELREELGLEKPFLSAFDMNREITSLKADPEHEWLKEIGIHTLQITCKDLSKAYKSFFKKNNGYPKFKSRKRAKPNFPVSSYKSMLYVIDDEFIKLPKIGKVSYHAKYKVFPIEFGRNKITLHNPRISFVNKKWILSFGLEVEKKDQRLKSDKSIGIDLGIKELATVAFGYEDSYVFHNINKSKRVRNLERKKKHLQRVLSRKWRQNGHNNESSNYIKVKRELEVVQQKLNNIRNNYIHQITHQLISLNPHTIVMEDLNVSGMMKNKHLAKSISEANFYEFIRQMKYKCEWNNINFIQVDRYYPSSKTCSCCGSVKSDLKLKDRVYICPECGLEIDRDYNAALNLMKYGSYCISELSA